MTETIEEQQMRVESERIFAALVSGAAKSVLPERIFVNSFLPYFSGEVPITESNNFASTWISVSGSPTAEVDIINESTGEVLYTVPALIDTSVINVTKKDSSINFSQIIALSKMYSNMTPMAGENVLKSNLDQKVQTLRQRSNNFSDYETKWLAILRRYNKIKDETTSIQQSAKAGTLSEDEMEF